MTLIKKIDNRSAKIGVIGLGYVGLPLAMEFVKAGFQVTGIDIDENKISSLNDGKNYINDVNDKDLENAVNKGFLSGSNDFSLVKDLDALSICVPTPLNKEKNPDISYIVSVMDKIKDYLHPHMIIILESTTYPGSTRELILPYIENDNLILGKNICLCFSPERIDPGNKTYNTGNTPKIVGGLTPECSKTGKKLYSTIINEVIVVSSPETAEMVKLLENTFRAINIGLANEIAIMCEKLGINAWEVIEAAATKPFGFMKFSPGPGLGGHCIPIDPHYLSWKLKTLDYDARFIELASDINTNMPKHVIKLIAKALNKNQKSINGSSILVIGVAYKKDIDDVRESPALDVLHLLKNLGAKTAYYDPHVKEILIGEEKMSSLSKLKTSFLKSYDLCAILTNHTAINFEKIYNNSKLIIDTRNTFPNKKGGHLKRLGQG